MSYFKTSHELHSLTVQDIEMLDSQRDLIDATAFDKDGAIFVEDTSNEAKASVSWTV